MRFNFSNPLRFLHYWSPLGAIAIALPLAIGTVSIPTQADVGHGEQGSPTTQPAGHGDGHGDPSADPGAGHGGGHGDNPGHHPGHHSSLEIPAGVPIPQVSLTAMPDPMGGWNLHIETENWTFAPERVNDTSLPTEGHAHLYVNGVKLTRLYGHWYYLEGLPPGDHTLTVGLNANGHEALTVQGEPIEASVSITVPAVP